jgi:hypothetical protein
VHAELMVGLELFFIEELVQRRLMRKLQIDLMRVARAVAPRTANGSKSGKSAMAEWNSVPIPEIFVLWHPQCSFGEKLAQRIL